MKSYGINLSDYFNADPGAIYRVELSFKNIPSMIAVRFQKIPKKRGDGYYDDGYYEKDYWDETYSADLDADEEAREEQYSGQRNLQLQGYHYNWYERDNPCHPPITTMTMAATNVLGSNLGFIKKGRKQNRTILP